jgi:sialidase-1
MLRADRSEHPNEGLTNPETLGFVPTEFVTIRSKDRGYSWNEVKIIESPFGHTPLELCSAITPLSDGRCFLPTSTWSHWDGSIPVGYRMVALVSRDLGKSWREYLDVMVDPKQETRYWESKIIELSDHRLLAVAWAYNHVRKEDLPNQYVISSNGGKSWSAPKSTGLIGQTLTPFLIDNNRIISIYRRLDKPGLWANISRIEKKLWINEYSKPLWGHNLVKLTGKADNMAQVFSTLKFGTPCLTALPDSSIFVAFWAVEDCISIIRWFKLIWNK